MPLPRESSRGRDLFGCSFQLMPLCCSAILRCLDGCSLVSSVAGLSEHRPGGPEGCAHPLQLSVAIRHQSWFPKLKFISFTAVGSVTPSAGVFNGIKASCCRYRRSCFEPDENLCPREDEFGRRKKKNSSRGEQQPLTPAYPHAFTARIHTHSITHTIFLWRCWLFFVFFFLCVWLLPMHGGKFFGIPFLFLWLMINMSLHVH